MNYSIYGNYVIYLINCAFSGTVPSYLPEETDIDKLFAFAKEHGVEAIVYDALKRMPEYSPSDLQKFDLRNKQLIAIDTMQQYYLDKISEQLEQEHIRFLVLKGFVIKKIYPYPHWRQAGDIDIYVDDSDTEKVKEIMERLGFAVERFNHLVQDDAYSCRNFVHVEVHRKLISNKCPWDEYCQSIADRLRVKKGFTYRLEMSPEDYYFYMIGHMAKHMKYSGFGIKMILDVWVYMTHYKSGMDMGVVEKLLKESGLYKFHCNVISMCEKWFGSGSENANQELEEYIFSSGNFGTHEQFVATDMAENLGKTHSKSYAKLHYYIKMIFLPYEAMCRKYKVLVKKPLLLPAMWIYRIFDAAILRRENISDIKNKYNNTDISEADSIYALKKKIGL